MLRLKLWAASVAAVLGGVLAAFFYGRRAGKEQAQATYQRRRIQAMQEAKEVERKHENLSSDDIDKRLDKWLRND